MCSSVHGLPGSLHTCVWNDVRVTCTAGTWSECTLPFLCLACHTEGRTWQKLCRCLSGLWYQTRHITLHVCWRDWTSPGHPKNAFDKGRVGCLTNKKCAEPTLHLARHLACALLLAESSHTCACDDVRLPRTRALTRCFQVYGLPFGTTRIVGRWWRPHRARVARCCRALLLRCAPKKSRRAAEEESRDANGV